MNDFKINILPGLSFLQHFFISWNSVPFGSLSIRAHHISVCGVRTDRILLRDGIVFPNETTQNCRQKTLRNGVEKG